MGKMGLGKAGDPGEKGFPGDEGVPGEDGGVEKAAQLLCSSVLLWNSAGQGADVEIPILHSLCPSQEQPQELG